MTGSLPGSPAEDASFDGARELLRLNKTLLALEELQRARAADPGQDMPYVLTGKAYAALGRKQAAVEMFEQFVKLEPTHKDAEKLKAIIAAYKGQ